MEPSVSAEEKDEKKLVFLNPECVTVVFVCVVVVWFLTCVALAGSRDQAVVFACCVDVTSIQSDGISLVVLHANIEWTGRI